MKNSWKQWNAALLILMSATILAMWFFIHNCCNGDGREGGSDKHEWSLMQVIENRNGNQVVRDFQFIDEEDYHIVAIPNLKGKTTWVMLNPRSPPYYKQSGDNFSLTQEQLERITRSRHTISTVEEALKSHLSEGK
jgi:hypothetical protein